MRAAARKYAESLAQHSDRQKRGPLRAIVCAFIAPRAIFDSPRNEFDNQCTGYSAVNAMPRQTARAARPSLALLLCRATTKFHRVEKCGDDQVSYGPVKYERAIISALIDFSARVHIAPGLYFARLARAPGLMAISQDGTLLSRHVQRIGGTHEYLGCVHMNLPGRIPTLFLSNSFLIFAFYAEYILEFLKHITRCGIQNLTQPINGIHESVSSFFQINLNILVIK